MKKSIIFLVALGFISLDLSAHTNKTHMRPMDSSAYMPNRFNFNNFFKQSKAPRILDAKLDIDAFHFFSSRSNQIGKYFGVNEKNEFLIQGKGSAETDNLDIASQFLMQQLDLNDTHHANIKLLPEVQHAGVNFGIIFGLNRMSEKLALKINVPYQRVHKNMRMGFSSSDNAVMKNIKNYLMGDYSLTNSQEALRYAKITDQQEKRGIPFVDVSLAYNLSNDSDLRNTIKASLIIPTNSDGTAEYLFEPVLGNAGHLGINLGLEGSKKIFDGKKGSLDLLWDCNYQYLFDATEKRTLGIKGANWGQYYLLGKNGVIGALIPAANILTQDVKVLPGAQINSNIEALFGYHSSRISVGGTFVARRDEKVRLKTPFPAQTYAVADTNFEPNPNPPVAFSLALADVADSYSTYGLNENNIDLTVAETPGSFLYKFYAQYAYDYAKINSEKMFTIALGGSVNLTDENSAINGYGLWLNSSFYF